MNSISKTLYIPLFGKAYVSRKGIILNDPKAEAIWEAEGFPLRGKAKSKWLAYYMGMRSAVFDRWTANRLKENPDALVLHIGCGMDSRACRLSAERVGHQWYDVDLPEVIQERERHYSQEEGYHMLVADAQETGWLHQLPDANTAIVVMEGISMYLQPDALQGLLCALRSRFARLHVLLDCYTSFGAKVSRYKNPINSVGVTQTHGMDDPEKLAADTGMTFVAEHSMTPEDLIGQLTGPERVIFRKLFAGGFAGRIYRMYELQSHTQADPVELAKQVATDLADSDDLTAANRYLDALAQQHEGFDKVASNLYRSGDILFNTGLRIAMEAHASGLEAVNRWAISSAPELIAYIRLKNQNDCLLITRIEGVSQSMPVPFSGSEWQKVSPEACRQFMADAEMMQQKRIINEAFLHPQTWHLIPSTGRIILSNWSQLCQLTGEGDGITKKIRKEFSSRGLM